MQQSVVEEKQQEQGLDTAYFPFPFPPYRIQLQLMRTLHHTLHRAGHALLESPTGTGKSLSLCCGALQWLNDHERLTIQTLRADIARLKTDISDMPESDDWLVTEYDKIKKTQELASLLAKLDKINKQIANFEDMKVRVNKTKKSIQGRTQSCIGARSGRSDDKKDINDGCEVNCDAKEEDTDLIMDDIENQPEDISMDDEEETEEELVKIYISSRTHSQLSQFVGEIKRTAFCTSTRVVTLASRQHFCINPEVTRLKNVNLINERCLDLQKSKTEPTSVGDDGKILKMKKTKGCTSCPYYNQSNITRLKERMLVDIMDMEDLLKHGKELKACPYYSSRAAMKDAQVVLVSHAGVVSSGARSGVSLRLTNNVLIIDEAHGLSAALEQAHSAPLSARQLASCRKYLQFYLEKYRSRLSSKNLLSLNQVLFVVRNLMEMIETKAKSKMADTTKVFTLEQFAMAAEIDHMNLRPLVDFCRNTRLAPKLHGFSMRYNSQTLDEKTVKTENKNSTLATFLNSISKKKVPEQSSADVKVTIKTEAPTEGSAGSSLYAVLNFLEMLCERSDNGRVLAQQSDNLTGQLKYLLLNPAVQFSEVVKQCRSVVVAGGTMEPMSEFHALLTGSTEPSESVAVLKCDHVVSPDNVLAICMSRGPMNLPLNFSYEHRQKKELLDEVGGILRNVAGVVQGGFICFLPSYSYEQLLYEHLNSTKLLEQISRKKKIFREPKSAALVDQVLNEFAAAVRCRAGGNTGALLLSVVGGKLSEGLNFSDDLGRCVVVVGMPYPNIKSPELREKMSYLDRSLGAGAGSLYYENLCMKAVNQCIGRAVRHANDYACVLLLDGRYSRPTTIAALPSFVQKSLKANLNFGAAFGSIAKFFARHKNQK